MSHLPLTRPPREWPLSTDSHRILFRDQMCEYADACLIADRAAFKANLIDMADSPEKSFSNPTPRMVLFWSWACRQLAIDMYTAADGDTEQRALLAATLEKLDEMQGAKK